MQDETRRPFTSSTSVGGIAGTTLGIKGVETNRDYKSTRTIYIGEVDRKMKLFVVRRRLEGVGGQVHM